MDGRGMARAPVAGAARDGPPCGSTGDIGLQGRRSSITAGAVARPVAAASLVPLASPRLHPVSTLAVPASPQSAAASPVASSRPAVALSAVCLFTGSSVGWGERYAEAARDMGRLLAHNGIGLVYGGARVGLMGAAADAALEAGGRVVGIIPQPLWNREVGHTELSELLVVDTMHERKALMAERADAFVALPGGAGTLEEFFEAWTGAQLGIHAKPCGVLNVAGYYDTLLAMLDYMVEERFVPAAHRQMIVVDEDPARLLARLDAYQAPTVTRWLTREET